MINLNAVLIVDDDPVSSYINKRLIEKLKISDKIIIARNGLDALKKLADFDPNDNTCPEMIILDMEMPVIDGMEFIESFKHLYFENKSNVKIIVNSASINEHYKELLLDSNIVGYFLKPLNEKIISKIADSIAIPLI